MHPIVITFTKISTGRIEFNADIMTADRLSFDTIRFKLDTGSEFTTLSHADLIQLGYEYDYLRKCKHYDS